MHHNAHVHHRIAGNGTGSQRLTHAFFHGGNELVGNRSALDLVGEFETGATWQRFDAQVHLAKLAGAAGLLLVAVLGLRPLGDGFAVGDARGAGIDLELVHLAHAVEHETHVQFTQAVDDGFVGGCDMLDAQAGVFRHQLAHDFPHALLVAATLGRNGHAIDGNGEGQGRQMHVGIFCGVVQHGVVMQFVHLADGTQVARANLGHLDMLLALHEEQVSDLEWLAAVADVKLAVAADGALMHAQHGELADVGVDADLEHLGQHMGGRVGRGVLGHGSVAFTAQEVGRVAFGRVGQHLDDDVQKLGHAGSGTGGHEAHRNQVALAHGLLQRGMQFGSIHVTFVQVALDEIAVHFHHLLHQGPMGIGHGAEIAVTITVEEAVHHLAGAGVGQVQRQAFLAEGLLDLLQQARQVGFGGIDLVDDDDAVQIALRSILHQAHGHGFDALGGIDDDGSGFHSLKRRQDLAGKIGQAGGVDHVDAGVAALHVHQCGLQRMLGLDFQRIVIADGAATLHRACRGNGASLLQQGLCQRGLAAACRAGQRQGSDVLRGDGKCGTGKCRHSALLLLKAA